MCAWTNRSTRPRCLMRWPRHHVYMERGCGAHEMWFNITWSHARSPGTQHSFSIKDVLDTCERQLEPLTGYAADVTGEQTPLFKHPCRKSKHKTSQTTSLERVQSAHANLAAGEGQTSKPDAALIDWTMPVRLPSETAVETWTSIPTSNKSAGSRAFGSQAERAQLESTDFLTPFRRSVYRLFRQPLRAFQATGSLITHMVPFMMLPFGFWVAFGLLITWR